MTTKKGERRPKVANADAALAEQRLREEVEKARGSVMPSAKELAAVRAEHPGWAAALDEQARTAPPEARRGRPMAVTRALEAVDRTTGKARARSVADFQFALQGPTPLRRSDVPRNVRLRAARDLIALIARLGVDVITVRVPAGKSVKAVIINDPVSGGSVLGEGSLLGVADYGRQLERWKRARVRYGGPNLCSRTGCGELRATGKFCSRECSTADSRASDAAGARKRAAAARKKTQERQAKERADERARHEEILQMVGQKEAARLRRQKTEQVDRRKKTVSVANPDIFVHPGSDGMEDDSEY